MAKKNNRPKILFKQIKKRNGQIVSFDQDKITEAIFKAFSAQGKEDRALVQKISDQVVRALYQELGGRVPKVEEIQDVVIRVIGREGYQEVAEAYSMYRQKRKELRDAKWWLLSQNIKTKLTPNALRVLESRYLKKDEEGKIVETPQQLFQRVAQNIASAESYFNPSLTDDEIFEIGKQFYQMMASLEFLPNSPTLMNAGGALQQLSACFVLPVGDSMEEIFEAVRNTALIHKSGGGTGFNFSRLRPKNDLVSSTQGNSSGPLSFMSVFNAATEVIKQGGCISYQSLVRTNHGVKPIAEFLDCPPLGDNPSRHLVYTNGQFERAFLAQDNGQAEVYCLKTKLGVEICSTYNHQIGVVNQEGEFDYKAAQEIKKGDWLIHVLGGHLAEDAELPEFNKKQHFNANQIKLPKKMNPELAELLGLYMADGCLSRGRIIFAVEKKDKELEKRIKYLMGRLFGLNYCRKEQKANENSFCLVFYSRDLADYFKQAGWSKTGAKQAFTPEDIFNSSKQSACAFVRGLFEGDGSVHSDGYPLLYSISEKLVKDVQQLLFGLGIVSGIRKSKIGNRYGKNPVYTLSVIQQRSIQEFINQIGYISSRKNKLLLARQKVKDLHPYDIIPNQGNLLRKLYRGPGKGCAQGRMDKGANRKLYRAVQHYLSAISNSSKRNLPRKKLIQLMEEFKELRNPRLAKMVNDEYFYSPVVEITKKRAATMDIMVPEAGHFVANSILVHNKRRGANMGILNVDHPDILEFIVAKEQEGTLNNFNISIALTDEFMEAVKKKKKYSLKNPRTGQPVKQLDANKVFDLIVHYAWKNGEPGVIFIDHINRDNPTPKLGEIESTNPCVAGETLVGVADGRNYVPIRELAEEGKDVPVYCYGNGKIQIKMGRNPRKTREKVPVWKVVLDDGSHIIATEDHKFITRDNKKVELEKLKLGASLMSFNRMKKEENWIVQNELGLIQREPELINAFFKKGKVNHRKPISLIPEFVNHKIESIKFEGYKDVYNITVDEFHNLVYITNLKKGIESGIITENCGEQPLLGYESCNLGSVNLSKMLKKKTPRSKSLAIDWDKLRRIVHTAVRFLDDVIEVNHYPISEIEKLTKGNRKIGLGVMGWADTLIYLGIPYNTQKAINLAGRIMKFIQQEGRKASVKLAEKRGVFPNFPDSIYNQKGKPRVRNATITTIAPTGTIGIIAGASSAIEPLFAVAYTRKHVLDGKEMEEVHPLFEQIARERGFYSKKIIEEVVIKGGVQQVKGVPPEVKKLFVTALEIKPEDHIKTQAAFQKYVDNATSKTINFPYTATEAEIKKAYLLAYNLGCKGMTLYRNESRKQQVLNIKGSQQGELTKAKRIEDKNLAPDLRDPSPDVPDLPSGSCPTCNI